MCRQQDNSNSLAQECKGHALSTKTLRSHITRELQDNALRQSKQQSRLRDNARAEFPHKYDLTIT